MMDRAISCWAVTRILRAGGVDVLPGVYADCVTPADLLKALEGWLHKDTGF